MKPWLDRVTAAIGPDGYDPTMRRSLQSVVLYEAKRAVDAATSSERRPLERKNVLLAQARELVQTCTFLSPLQRSRILWRTMTSKEELDADVAWNRVRLIEKELAKLSKLIRPYLGTGKTHDQACDSIVHRLFDESTARQGRPVPTGWEHKHNHVILVFRLYYKGDQKDTRFPPPPSLTTTTTTTSSSLHHSLLASPPKSSRRPTAPSSTIRSRATAPSSPTTHVSTVVGESSVETDASSWGPVNAVAASDERRKILQEVREHLELLKEFEDVISENDIAHRKRELFLALPPAPPVASAPPNKKVRYAL